MENLISEKCVKRAARRSSLKRHRITHSIKYEETTTDEQIPCVSEKILEKTEDNNSIIDRDTGIQTDSVTTNSASTDTDYTNIDNGLSSFSVRQVVNDAARIHYYWFRKLSEILLCSEYFRSCCIFT